MEELLTTLVESNRIGDIEDFVLLLILYQLSMIWLPNTKQAISKYLFKYCNTLKSVQVVAWAMSIHEKTIRGVQDAKRAMEKGTADVYMYDFALVNVSLILTIFFSLVHFFLILIHIYRFLSTFV